MFLDWLVLKNEKIELNRLLQNNKGVYEPVESSEWRQNEPNEMCDGATSSTAIVLRYELRIVSRYSAGQKDTNLGLYSSK